MTKKNVSSIVSGMGLGLSILTTLAAKAKRVGLTDEELHGLATSDGEKYIEELVASMVKARNTGREKFPCELHASDLIPEGWTVVEDVSPSDLTRGVEFVPFVKNGEGYINGELMRQRAVELKGNLGLSDVKYLLTHQELIPVEFRGNNYIVLPGTVLRSPDGRLGVPCLSWFVERWVLHFSWLGYCDWCGLGRMVRCK